MGGNRSLLKLRVGKHGALLDPVADRPDRNDGIHNDDREKAVGICIGEPTGTHKEQNHQELFRK